MGTSVTYREEVIAPTVHSMAWLPLPETEASTTGYSAFEKLLDWYGLPHWSEASDAEENGVVYGTDYIVYYWATSKEHLEVLSTWHQHLERMERSENA